jgi:hypothetical protein
MEDTNEVEQLEKSLKEELEYLRWFRINADFGPSEGDVIIGMEERYEEETGNKVPEQWKYE